MVYLLKRKKDDAIKIVKESGIEVQNILTKGETINRIIQSEFYVDEIVEAVMEGILEEKREKTEELRQIKEFALERLILVNITDRVSVSSEDLESQRVNKG
ncbi:hypothetical protein NPIL_103501 [Nephila pilipes]|uniref:Uncharacterized protein n=1 Tax=Nephila pilipes TaxID=299642 RepID=A0A8X6Q3P9_NEPPI|nr:hypothetical protein NPIL_103501 [Nephila pilipes]